MRIISTSACALAVVCMAGSVSADDRRPLAVTSAQVSATGEILFVTGKNFGAAPEVRLGGTLLRGVVVTSATELKAYLPFFEPGSYKLEVTRKYWWYWQQYDDNDNVARMTVVIGAAGPPGEPGSMGETGAVGPQGDKGDKGDPGMPGNLALAGQSCPPGVPLRGFSASGGLICGLNAATSCGNGVLDNGEEFDPAPGPFGSAPVNASSCKFDFSRVTQLFCNGGCSKVGLLGCDQADADLLCKLKTGNAASVASLWEIENVRDEAGFACPIEGLGTPVANLRGRGVDVPVFYSESPLLESHGPGHVVTNVVCTP